MGETCCEKEIGPGADPPPPLEVSFPDEAIEVTGSVSIEGTVEVTGTVSIDGDQWQALLDAINGIEINLDGATINANTVAPITACLDGCREITLCVTKGTDIALDIIGWGEFVDGKWVAHPGDPAGNVTLGACPIHRMCVRLWLPNADGTYFTCPGPEYTIDLAGNGRPKAWFVAEGLYPVDDPTEGLEHGVDYVLLPCGADAIGETPTEQAVPVPYDLNSLPEFPNGDNVLDGSVTLTDVCSLTIRPDVDLDCTSGTPGATIEYTDAAGNQITETVHAGDERCYQCLGSEVTITGAAIVYATTTEMIPLDSNGDCP